MGTKRDCIARRQHVEVASPRFAFRTRYANSDAVEQGRIRGILTRDPETPCAVAERQATRSRDGSVIPGRAGTREEDVCRRETLRAGGRI